jgi:hypothetical protein
MHATVILSLLWLAGLVALWVLRPEDFNPVRDLAFGMNIDRKVSSCYTDPSYANCRDVPLPLDVAQRAVDFPLVVPCWLPPHLNREPHTRMDNPGVITFVYVPADAKGFTDLYSITQSNSMGLGGGIATDETSHQIGGAHLLVKQNPALNPTWVHASWRHGGVNYSMNGPWALSGTTDDAVLVARSMILGCG